MEEIVKGFKTDEGIKLYDYNSLANLPDLSTYLEKTEVVSSSEPNKIIRLNEKGKIPSDVLEYSDTGETNVEIDKTLTIPDMAADAKVVGDRIIAITPVYQNEEPDLTTCLWIDLDDDTDDVPIVDSTLTKDGFAADSGVVGRELNKKQPIGDYALKSDIPEIPELITDTTLTLQGSAADAYTVGQELNKKQPIGDYALRSEIPEIPELVTDKTLTQPNAAADAYSVGQELAKKQPIGDYALKSDIPEVQEVITDKTLTQVDMPADSYTVGQELSKKQPIGDYALKSEIPEIPEIPELVTDKTLSQAGKAADAQIVGQELAKKQPVGNYALKSDIPVIPEIPELVTDKTLTQSGEAADAQIVGQELAKKQPIGDYALRSEIPVIPEIPKIIVDSELSGTSTNPVQNKIISTQITSLNERVGSTKVSEQISNALANFESGKTLTEHLQEEMMVLTPLQYGDTLPEPGIVGRIFFKKVVQ